MFPVMAIYAFDGRCPAQAVQSTSEDVRIRGDHPNRYAENWQIDPEQSTSAIIVHHPEAKYFAV